MLVFMYGKGFRHKAYWLHLQETRFQERLVHQGCQKRSISDAELCQAIKEVQGFKKLAGIYAAISTRQLADALKSKELVEICHDQN
ncbi:MAG: hypothetical protein V4724_27345 [Pseudomonadota bacterium]